MRRDLETAYHLKRQPGVTPFTSDIAGGTQTSTFRRLPEHFETRAAGPALYLELFHFLPPPHVRVVGPKPQLGSSLALWTIRGQGYLAILESITRENGLVTHGPRLGDEVAIFSAFVGAKNRPFARRHRDGVGASISSFAHLELLHCIGRHGLPLR